MTQSLRAGSPSDPSSQAQGCLQRALALLELGRGDEALRVIGEGLAVAPSHPGLLRAKGAALHRLGRLAEALAASADAIAADPNSPAGHNLRSSVLADIAKEEPPGRRRGIALQAGRSADEAIRLDPRSAAGFVHRAAAMAYAGEKEESWRDARKAVELAPNDPASWVALSHTGLVCQADPVAVEAATRRALKIDPLSYAALNNLGVALTRQGRKREAAPVLRQAAALSPTQQTAVNNLVAVGMTVLRIAVLLLLCGLFLTPIGPGAIVVLLAAFVVMRKAWAVRRLRGLAIRIAMSIPRVRLPAGTTILGAAAIVTALVIFIVWHGSDSLGYALIALGSASIAFAPLRKARARRRLARFSFDTFPERPVIGPLSRAQPRIIGAAYGLFVLGSLIASGVSNNSPSTINPSWSFNGSVPQFPQTDLPNVPGAAPLDQPLFYLSGSISGKDYLTESSLPAGYSLEPSQSGSLSDDQINTDYNNPSTVLSAYRDVSVGPRGEHMIRTVLIFDDPNTPGKFVIDQIARSAPDQPYMQLCPGVVFTVAATTRDPGVFLLGNNAVIDVRLHQQSADSQQLLTAANPLIKFLTTVSGTPTTCK